MIIKPLGKSRFKPIALIVPGWKTLKIITINGEKIVTGSERCYQALRSLENHSVFVANKLKNLIQSTGAECWQAEVWKGRATSMRLDGTRLKVTSLRRVLDSLPSDSARFDALLEVSLWLSDQGVPVNSISGMAWNLWRSTLSKPLDLAFDSKVGRSAFYGGRQEAAEAKTFKNQVSIDISSAYPFSMAERPYGGVMREVSKNTELDPTRSGLARATVRVPSSCQFPPLPVRINDEMSQWQYGLIEGTWPWAELAAAKAVGCEVTVTRCWAPLVEVDPFTKWWDVVYNGRADVSPEAAKLIKAVSNSLWGMFGMTGDDRAIVRWADSAGDDPHLVQKVAKKMPQANTAHIAAETTGRVRTRMLLEGLYGDNEVPAHIDTDGIIISKDSASRRKLGDGPGEWRMKQEMPFLDVMAPQLYRYKCGDGCGTKHSIYHYVASGVSPEWAAELFNNRHPGINISFSGRDAVIPTGPALDLPDLARYEIEAKFLRNIVYGQPLIGVK